MRPHHARGRPPRGRVIPAERRLFCGVACGAASVRGAGGPGRCVCRWAAARPRAVRAASFARRVASKPGQAPPPPTGTAAAPSGALHTSGALSLTCGRGVVLKLVPAPLSLTVARCRRCVAPPDCVCCAFLHAGSLISHVIPLRLFQDLNCDRWYFNVSACCCGVGPIELRAIFLGVGLRLRVGVADPLRETGLPVLVRACVGLKPPWPLLARTCLGLKPVSPLRVRYGCF